MPIHEKYTEDMLIKAVAESTSVAAVLRALGLKQAGGTHTHISRRIKAFGIDTSHFVRWQNGSHRLRLQASQILVLKEPLGPRAKPYLLHRALLEIGRAYECAACGIDGTWRGLPLRLEVDHIDGRYHNNVASNLRFLCPNCHRQTDNFAGRSKGKFSRDPEGMPAP